MTHRVALLRAGLCVGCLLVFVRLPARAQVLRVAAGDRELARAEVSNTRGYPALPVTLLVPLGADVNGGRGAAFVTLFGDTLRFRPGHAWFEVNGRKESLHSWAYHEDGVLFIAQWFFTRWLPSQYPERLTYRDGVLRIAAGSPPVVRRPADDAAGAEHARVRVTTRAAAAPQPVAAERPVPASDTTRAATTPHAVTEQSPIPAPRRGVDDPLRGVLLGFIDARVSGVFDSNIDHDPVAQGSYGTMARLGVGIQSARPRPFLMARYDFALHRFANSDAGNRTTHDVSGELAPSLGAIRLRLGAAVRIGSWTEDRQPANQIILRPQIEIRPTPIHLINLYAVHSARRIDTGAEIRRDTFRLAGVGYYVWWHGGGLRVDGRYEVNQSELERSRYVGWTGRSWIRIPFASSHRLTLETAHNRRRYAHNFVDQAGTVARTDRRWTSSVSLSSEFARALWELGVEWEFEDNQSNDAYAVYQAHRVEFMVRRRW